MLDKDPIGSFSQTSAATQEEEFDVPSFNLPVEGKQRSSLSDEEYDDNEDADLTAPFLFDLPQNRSYKRKDSISSIPSIDFPNTQHDTVVSDFSSVHEGLAGTVERLASDTDSIISDFSTESVLPPVDSIHALTLQPPPLPPPTGLVNPIEFDFLAHRIPSPFSSRRNKRKLVDLSKGGLADSALESVNRERRAHRQWETSINQQCRYLLTTHYDLDNLSFF